MSTLLLDQSPAFDAAQPLASSLPVGSFEDYIESLQSKASSVTSISTSNQPSFSSAFNDNLVVSGDHFDQSFNNPAWVIQADKVAGSNLSSSVQHPKIESFIVCNEQTNVNNDHTYHDNPNWTEEQEKQQWFSSSSQAHHKNNMNMVKKRGLFSRSGGSSSLHTKSMASTSAGVSSGMDRLSGDSSGGSANGKSPTASSSGLSMTGEVDEEKFNGEGVMFVGKLIGTEYVAEARGELMCQQSLKKLKILKKAAGGHKQKINMFISYEGIKIYNALMTDMLYHHTVPQISFISRDESDARAFGYVFGNSTTGHQFIGIKTKKEAMLVMSTIGQLFAITLKRKRAAEEKAALYGDDDQHQQQQMVVMATGEEGSSHYFQDQNGRTSSLMMADLMGSSRARRQRNISSSSENVPIPAIPPPTSSAFDFSRRHLHLSHSSLPPPPPTKKIIPDDLFAEEKKYLEDKKYFHEAARLRLAQNADSEKEFSAFTMPAPRSGKKNWIIVGHVNQGQQQQQQPSHWANFDDDDEELPSLYQNISSRAEDTLNSISSISDVNNSNLSTSANRSITSGNDSTTLVPRHKFSAKNGSQSTIASSNFDGVDPFSDVFGDDPFNASTIGDTGLSASFASNKAGPVAAPQAQAASTANLYQQVVALPPATGLSSSFSSRNNTNINNNCSFRSDTSKQSFESSSSADRYAALADIHAISTSIFDVFSNKPSTSVANQNEDSRSASRISNKSSESAGKAQIDQSQASTFQTVSSVGLSSSNLFPCVLEQKPSDPTVLHPSTMSYMASSQPQYNAASVSLTWSANSASTNSLPTLSGNYEQQQQQQQASTISSTNLFQDLDPIGSSKKSTSFLEDKPGMFMEQKQRQQVALSSVGFGGHSPSNSMDTEHSSKQASSPALSSATNSPASSRRTTTTTCLATSYVTVANNASLTTPPTQTASYTRLSSSGVGSGSPSPSSGFQDIRPETNKLETSNEDDRKEEHREIQTSYRSTSSTSLLNEDVIDDEDEHSDLKTSGEHKHNQTEAEEDGEEDKKDAGEDEHKTGPPSISSLASTSLNLSKFEASFDEVFADNNNPNDPAARRRSNTRVEPHTVTPPNISRKSSQGSCSSKPEVSGTPPLPPRTDLPPSSSRYRYSGPGPLLPPPPPYSKPTPQPYLGYPYGPPHYPPYDPYATLRAYSGSPAAPASVSGSRILPPQQQAPPTSGVARGGDGSAGGGGNAPTYDYLYDVPSSIPLAPPPSYYGLTPPPHYAYHDYYRQYYADHLYGTVPPPWMAGPPVAPPPVDPYYGHPLVPPPPPLHYPPLNSIYDSLPIKPRPTGEDGSRPGSSVSRSHIQPASSGGAPPPPLPLPQRRISSTSLQERPYPMSSFLVGRCNSSASTAPPTVETTPRTPPTMAHGQLIDTSHMGVAEHEALAFHYPPLSGTMGRHSRMSGELQAPAAVGSYLASFNAHMQMINQQYQAQLQQHQQPPQAIQFASEPTHLLIDTGNSEQQQQQPQNQQQQQSFFADFENVSKPVKTTVNESLFDDNFGNVPIEPNIGEAKQDEKPTTNDNSTNSSSPSQTDAESGSSTLKKTNNNNNNDNNNSISSLEADKAKQVDIFQQAEDPFANDPFFQS